MKRPCRASDASACQSGRKKTLLTALRLLQHYTPFNAALGAASGYSGGHAHKPRTIRYASTLRAQYTPVFTTAAALRADSLKAAPPDFTAQPICQDRFV